MVPTPSATVVRKSSPPGVSKSNPRDVSCATTAATTAAPRVAAKCSGHRKRYVAVACAATRSAKSELESTFRFASVGCFDRVR